MDSSMAANERRWTSTRKSGMIVLGKVPKPINLPSQKLENHGLDPNVEIVPKGTLTWGARPPLVASNTWGTSALSLSSPQADGSVNSPNFANGRPSSGGSGTRPSTSSSERSNEPATSLWGPSSRPSSASGILPTCHISAAANRPRSAETRSSSSQLSRFAESLDNTAVGAAGNLGKFAAETSKRCDFTLSSGDFPTLGSEKSYELKSQQGNGNPGQALHGTFNSWSADSDPHAGKGASTRSENWQRDYHNALPQLTANIPPQQFVSWNGHPVHPPNGVWYGGHEAGGPYRLPGPLQSCHIGMYSPYPTAGRILNTEAFPRPEAIPGRVQLKNGEACSYMHPESYFAHSQSVIPVKPGIYPGPILYEGCYGPPCKSSDNSSEQDTSTKGMPRPYGVHNLHSSEKLRQKLQRFHAQAAGFDAVRTKEQMVPAHTNETQGHYNVLLKQHDSCKDKEAFERGNQLGFSAPEAGLLNNSYKQEQTTDRQHGEVHHSQHADDLVDPIIGNSLETSKVAGDDVTTKPVTATKQVSHIQHNPIIIKNASLMEKVEGLNSKARVVEVHFEGEILPTKEKMKSDCRSNTQHFQKADLANASSAINCISGSSNVFDCQVNSFTKDSTHQSAISSRVMHGQSAEQTYVPDKSSYTEDGGQSQPHNQKRVHDIKAKVDLHHEKLKFGTYGDDGMNSIMQRHSLEDINMAAGKSGHELSMPGLCASEVTPSDESSRIILKSGSYPSTLESTDLDVQHTKLKELARQRAIQIQKEEEQRTMEQKAKALAKLNELNLRTSASSKHNLSHPIPLCNDILNEHETASCKDAEANTSVIEAPWSCLSCDFAEQKQANDDNNVKKLRDPADFLHNEFSRASQSSFQVSGTPSEQSLSSGQRSTTVIVTGRAVSDSHDSNVPRRKQAGYRRRRNVLDERSQSDKLTNFENSGNTKSVSMAPEYLTNSLGILNNEDHIQTRNKNNSGPKYKNKLIDSQPNSPLPASPHPEGSSGKFDLESDETKSLATGVEVMPVSEKISDEPAVDLCSIGLRVPPNQAGSETRKSTFVRASNYWKPHPHRKPARNLQSDKTKKYQGSETVVWAPVKLVCKNESSVVHKSSTSQITDLPDGKIGLDIHSGAKVRRAEMERYVPKPIAKELSLHGGSQLSSPLSAPVSSADVSKELDLDSASAQTGRDCNSEAEIALASANRNIENNKQNRHGKLHASWQQRSSGESESHGQGAVECGLFSETPKCVEKTTELQPSVPSDNWHVGGGNGMRDEPTSELGAIKNNSGSRQRRQQFKTQRVDGSSYSLPLSNVLQGEEPEKSKIESQIPDDSGERYSSRNENQNAGSDHTRSHWKPKSRVHPQQSSHDYKGSGGERAADKLLPLQATANFFDDSNALCQVKNMIEVNDRKYLEGNWEGNVMTNATKYQEGTRERKVMTKPSKYENQPLVEDLFIHKELGASNADSHHKHLGVRGHGQYHGRFPRVRNSAHGGSQRGHSSVQVRDDDQNFEYQKPVNYDELGDTFQQNSGASEEAAEAYRVLSGARYRVQGRRGGHFYGPHCGPANRVSGAYNN